MEDNEPLAPFGLPEFLLDPLGSLRRRWPWMLAALLLGLGSTILFVFLKSPRYLASATVVATGQRIPEDFVRPSVEESALARVDTLLGEVLSRDTLATLVARHQLYPEVEGSTAAEERLVRARADVEVSQERGFGAGSGRGGGRLLRISFTAGRPDVAAAVANEIADLFTAASIRIRTSQARLTTAFLTLELERIQRELREQYHKVTAYKERYRGELPSELASNVSKLDRLQQQRQSLALQIAEAEGRLASISSAIASSGSEAPPEVRLVQLHAELAEALGVMTERHPEVLRLRRQIKELEQEIGIDPGSENMPSLAASSQRTIEELRTQLSETEARIRDLDARVERAPAREEELAVLEEEHSLLRESYLEFSRKVQEAQLAESLEEAQQGERFSMVDRAVPPSKPTGDRWVLLAAGTVLSLGFAAGVGVLLEVLDPVVVTAKQLELTSGVPVLGSIPRIS